MGKQPSMGQKKSKEAIARAALASRKTSKKKWSKGKEKEKKDLAVFVTPK
jgi:small subunit ribosomal protein S25e